MRLVIEQNITAEIQLFINIVQEVMNAMILNYSINTSVDCLLLLLCLTLIHIIQTWNISSTVIVGVIKVGSMLLLQLQYRAGYCLVLFHCSASYPSLKQKRNNNNSYENIRDQCSVSTFVAFIGHLWRLILKLALSLSGQERHFILYNNTIHISKHCPHLTF